MLNPQEGGRLDAKKHLVILAKALDGIWPVGHACPVPWLRWPNVSWHQVFRLPEGWASIMPAIWSSESIENISWTYREPIVNLSWTVRESNYGASIVNLSRIYFEPIVNLLWTYPRCQPFEVCLNLWKSWKLVWNWSIWLDVGSYSDWTEPYGSRSFPKPPWPQEGP